MTCILFNNSQCQNNETMAKDVVCKCSICVWNFDCYKNNVPLTQMAVTDNPRDFIIKGTLQKNQIHITRHLLWDTLEINWSSVLQILCNNEVTLLNLVTIPLKDKYRVRSIINRNELISYIMLLTGVIW